MSQSSIPFQKFPPNVIVFDGRKTLLSCQDLKIKPILNESVQVPEDPEDPKKMLEVHISIKPVGFPRSLKEIIAEFEKYGAKDDFQPLDAVQTLNIILNYSLKLDPKMVVLGRKYFDPDKGKNVKQIDEGKYVWRGSYESVRVGWKIRLNVVSLLQTRLNFG